jgi:multidrug efflux pump subunit AcrA (membrane-fusion protein)
MMVRAMTTQNPGEVAAAQAAQARGAAEAAREQAQQARDLAQQQREAAQEARQAARDAAQEARDAANENQGTGTITIVKDGKTITLDNASPDAVATALGLPQPDSYHPVDPGPYIMGGIGMVATAIVLIVGLTLRYRIRVRGAAPAALSADVTQRLARMEAGIESVAVEVERISEGQRFTTRLLSDRERVEVPRG